MKKAEDAVTELDKPTAYMLLLCQRAFESSDFEAHEHANSVLSASVVTLRHMHTRYPKQLLPSLRYLEDRFAQES